MGYTDGQTWVKLNISDV